MQRVDGGLDATAHRMSLCGRASMLSLEKLFFYVIYCCLLFVCFPTVWLHFSNTMQSGRLAALDLCTDTRFVDKKNIKQATALLIISSFSDTKDEDPFKKKVHFYVPKLDLSDLKTG